MALIGRRASVARVFVGMLVLGAALAACSASRRSESVQSPPAAALAQPTNWKALLIAGDDRQPAFDNAVATMAERLASFGVPRSNMTILKATGRGSQTATLGNIEAAIAILDPSASEGCFVFVTSHGKREHGLVIGRGAQFLDPGELAAMLEAPCRDRPTVVIASGCYSGSFAEGGPMPAPNRIILTAARDDRASFGCHANLRFTVFDRCVLESLDQGIRWLAVMDKARGCVGAAERALNAGRSSEPQLSIGAAVGNLRVFPDAAMPAG